MSLSQRQEYRADLVAMDGRADDETLDASTLFVVFPVLASLVPGFRDSYLTLHGRYRDEGPSAMLTIDVLEVAGDLGTLLQALRRIDRSLTEIAQKRPKLSPPLPLLDSLHASLVMLTGDAPDTATQVMSPDELNALFDLFITERWLPEMERWMAGMARSRPDRL